MTLQEHALLAGIEQRELRAVGEPTRQRGGLDARDRGRLVARRGSHQQCRPTRASRIPLTGLKIFHVPSAAL